MLLNKRISVLFFLDAIKKDLIVVVLYAFMIGFADQYAFLSKIEVPIAITSSLGTAVVLLLAFRVNQSYERWWEARSIWGAVVNDSRTLVRQMQSFCGENTREGFVEQMAERQAVWCFALGEHLRKLPWSTRVLAYIQKEKNNVDHVPNALLSTHSLQIKEAYAMGYINSYQQVQLDSTIARLCDAMGKCERIKSTVFPKSYSLLIHFIIYVFATLLPFGLDDKYIAVEIGLTILIPSVFIAIEKTSILMQDPFENLPLDTPMTALAITIEKNLRSMTGQPQVVQLDRGELYYQL